MRLPLLLVIAFASSSSCLRLSARGRTALLPAASRLLRQPRCCELPEKAALPSGKELLLGLGQARTTAAERTRLLDTLVSLSVEERTVVLDDALAALDEVRGVALRRWPLRLPSRRLTLGCYARLLRRMEAEEPGSGARFQEGERPRTRRYLSVLLRQLGEGADGSRGVWALEGNAGRSAAAADMDEMLRRTPDGLETPRYEVLDARAGWEVRAYADFSVCSWEEALVPAGEAAAGERAAAGTMRGAAAFQSLAGYIFGGNAAEEKMAMTTPVLTTPGAKGRRMSFVLPSRYWGEGQGGAPAPKDGTVTLEGADAAGLTRPGSAVAALWFGGFAGPEEVSRRLAALRGAVADDAAWREVAGAEPTLMQYNDPFTPPWKRRNEIALPVVATAA